METADAGEDRYQRSEDVRAAMTGSLDVAVPARACGWPAAEPPGAWELPETRVVSGAPAVPGAPAVH